MNKILSRQAKFFLLDCILHGWKQKSNVLVPVHEFDLLRELELIIEEGEKVFVNSAKILSVQFNETIHYFVQVAFESFFLVENLNFHPSKTLKFELSSQDELLANIEKYLEDE